nr:winged helix-turn-helix domain-containing protein [Aquabacter sp. L1I39]
MGDPARAHMLCALMGGMALTAGELADHGGITPQTASGHLAQMVAARLLVVERQGRHRYFRLAGIEVAEAVAALMALAATGPRRHRPPGPRDAALRRARTCYDHMAGRLAVALAAALEAGGHVELHEGAGLVTPAGRLFLAELGIDAERSGVGRRPLCRTCLDWSERRPHLAGRLGAALLARFLALDWVACVPGSRALTVTRKGESGFADWFGIAARGEDEQPGRL